MKNIFAKVFGLLLATTACLFAQCNKPISDDDPSEHNSDLVAFCEPCEIQQNSILVVESSPLPIYLDIDDRRVILDNFPVKIAILAGEKIAFKALRETVFHITKIEPREDYQTSKPVNIRLPNSKARIGTKNE